MKKAALINLKFKIDIDFERKESLGIAYISSMLKTNGIDVTIIDGQYFNMDVDEVYRIIKQKDYDLLAFSLYEETMDSFNDIYELIKDNTKAHIVLGGHYATFTAEYLLNRFKRVNSISIGEGELTILELVQNLENERWKKIDGICYMSLEGPIYTSPRRLIEDLDSIPYPDRDVYFGNSMKDNGIRTATISASRGCYANCSFCSIKSFYKTLKGKSIRIRSPKKLVDEIEYLIKQYNIHSFFFADDNFLSTKKINPQWINDFLNEIMERKLEISFDIDCRVDDIDEELFLKLKRAGLRGVFLGIESFSQRVLDTMNKKVFVQDNIDAIMKLRKLRITVWMGFIMFDPFTTLDEIRVNVECLKKIKYFTYFNYDRPLSGDRLASPLKLYNGTTILKTIIKEQPELLITEEFGYNYKFLHKKTETFYSWLLKWKEVSKEMIQLDTLYLIRRANQKQENKIGNELHQLSRRYMNLDLSTFQEILDAVDENRLDQIPAIIKLRQKEFYEIKKTIDTYREKLFA